MNALDGRKWLMGRFGGMLERILEVSPLRAGPR